MGALGAEAESVCVRGTIGATVGSLGVVREGSKICHRARNDTVVGVVDFKDEVWEGEKASRGVSEKRASLAAPTMGTDRQQGSFQVWDVEDIG